MDGDIRLNLRIVTKLTLFIRACGVDAAVSLHDCKVIVAEVSYK